MDFELRTDEMSFPKNERNQILNLCRPWVDIYGKPLLNVICFTGVSLIKKAQPLRALSSNNFDSQLGLITNRCLGNEPPKSPFSGRNIRADPRVGVNRANSQLFHGNAYTDVVLTCFVDAFGGIVLFADP